MSYSNSFRDQLHRLVNNPYLADVKFFVGRKRKLIYGHQLLLMHASDVFKTLFNKNLVKIQRKCPLILVEDIEPDIFLDVLNFIYTNSCEISRKNTLPLLYAASKYKLYDLEARCEEFLIKHLDLAEWLQIFIKEPSESRNHRVREMSELQIIANPIAVFDQPTFRQLNSAQLIKIVDLNLQCSDRQLLDAIDRWLEHQPECERMLVEPARQNVLRKITSEHIKPKQSGGSTHGCLLPYLSGVLMASRSVSLYGMGIYTGVASELGELSVVIEVGCCGENVVRESVQLRTEDSNTKGVQECYFRQLRLSQGEPIKLTVWLSGVSLAFKKRWYEFVADKTADISNGDFKLISSENEYFVSPVAYMIYDVVDKWKIK